MFSAYYLPKDDEYYQFCYVDQDGVIRGASIPFQFRPENEEDILVVTPQVRKQVMLSWIGWNLDQYNLTKYLAETGENICNSFQTHSGMA